MSEEPSSSKEGVSRIVLLVLAFPTMPLPVYLMARAGYTAGLNRFTLFLLSLIMALALWIGGFVSGCIQAAFALTARTSSRFVVRRLALFTFIVATVGSVGSCVGGCVWGHKVSTREWAEPSL